MKTLFCFLILAFSLATEAKDFKCRKLNPSDYAYDIVRNERRFMVDCFYKRLPSPETGTWDIEFILEPLKKQCSYKDEVGKRECIPKFDFTDDRLMYIEISNAFGLVTVRHCTDQDRFFGVFRDTAGTVYGTNGIFASYFVECQPR